MEPFKSFPKIPRWSRDIIITEKIDGTNASVHISLEGEVVAASKNRYITPQADNYGFAKWVEAHREELKNLLGPGEHFGEWWGPGIQRGYGLKEKRFSLFNVDRWKDFPEGGDAGLVFRVPTLYVGPNSEAAIVAALEQLNSTGSLASPGFMRPEGIVIYHIAGGHLYKKTFEGDEGGKEKQNEVK